VTFSDLGPRGRLGNHLWQIAAVIGRSIEDRLPIRLPPWKFSSAFTVPSAWFTAPGEDDVEVYDLVDYLLPDDRYVLQDIRLWWDHQDTVRRYLSPAAHVVEAAKLEYGEALSTGGLTSVHIRRGDYLKYPSVYPLPSIDYYRQAAEGTPPENIIVFTDDPGWVSDNLAFLRDASMTSGPANFIDLACMTMCDRHVIANSSFSWWGAFLSGSDDVVHPSRWYTDEWAPMVSAHMLPTHWTPGTD
jgi:hypothetical protein